ncbi:hypothetical protein DY000_02054315 [Brassica cretica]|uniref:Uncharacterized protein n=1 Tax=Brassica cretica TaxID=69181 RepID=A0ABQ7AHH0_BRACR|nr:hypothetical protein DY000_02054315 [Brassica cretica]
MISWGTSMVNNLVSGVTQTIGVGGEAWRTAFLSSNLSSFGISQLVLAPSKRICTITLSGSSWLCAAFLIASTDSFLQSKILHIFFS